MTGPLMVGITGGNVAAVQRRLVTLGIEVPGAERREDRYATEAAIRRFQTQQCLPITGVVDDATALAFGVAGVHPRAITGIVSRPDGTPSDGIAVRIHQQALRSEKVAAETRSGVNGSFSLPWPDNVTAGLSVRVERGHQQRAIRQEARSAMTCEGSGRPDRRTPPHRPRTSGIQWRSGLPPASCGAASASDVF